MSSPPSFPDRLEAVTAEWMNQVLATSLTDAEVARLEVLDEHSGTTGRMRVRLHYAAGSTGPETVFVKLPPFDAQQQQLVSMTDMGRREARFYESLAAETPLRVPRSYFAAHGDEPTQYVMVLEDLLPGGATFTNRLEPHTVANTAQIIESLGRLHAHFWEDPRFETELAWLTPAVRHELGAQLIRSARDQFAADSPPVFTALCDLYIEHWEQINEIWDEGPKTMVHGDTHVGNHFVQDGNVGLYDWAVISRSPGMRDIALFVGNSVPTEMRREHQDEWLRAYHRVLVESGVDAPSYDEVFDRFRLLVLYSWMGATATASMGSKWQRAEIGLTGMRQGMETCADLGTVEAMRERL